MDLLSQHEAFLRAIFDAPDDDTPRLVYADFLQENGDDDRAEFIRLDCERWPFERPSFHGLSTDGARAELERISARQEVLRERLVRAHPVLMMNDYPHIRGFRFPGYAYLPPEAPSAPNEFREWVVFTYPEWFGATSLKVNPGRVFGPNDIDHLLRTPAFQRVEAIDCSGHVEELATGSDGTDETFALMDVVQHPVITTAAVETLARHRGARRITSLNLIRNNLDNDAARALVKSPYLDNLTSLQLLEGNRLRGKVWQLVIERFGEDVVG
jgi:uncharacterized protein (TIGR02996 family)